MTSELRSMNAFERIKETWRKHAEEDAAWLTANPKTAADWDEALAMHEDWKETRRRNAARRRLLESIATRLPDMGVPLRVAEELQAEERIPAEKRRFWEQKPMLVAREFVEKRPSFMLLFGGVGSGKTCAAAWTLLQAHGGDGYLDKYKGTFVRAAEAARISRFEDDGRWDRLLTVRWLVIDDLGVEVMTDYWAERINELLDTRYGNRLQTALTTNLSAEEFKAVDRYGDRISSRIRDDGLIAGCGTTDFRGLRPDEQPALAVVPSMRGDE